MQSEDVVKTDSPQIKDPVDFVSNLKSSSISLNIHAKVDQ